MGDADVLDALSGAYDGWIRIVDSLTEEQSWLQTGCAGWCVRDLTYHLLTDMQRALVTLSTPSADAPDRTRESYWQGFFGDSELDPDARQLRALRTMSAAWGLESLKRTVRETALAVINRAASTGLPERVATQGHTLTTDDFLSTLTVEAIVHHLDLPDELRAADLPTAHVEAVLGGYSGLRRSADVEVNCWIRQVTGRADAP